MIKANLKNVRAPSGVKNINIQHVTLKEESLCGLNTLKAGVYAIIKQSFLKQNPWPTQRSDYLPFALVLYEPASEASCDCAFTIAPFIFEYFILKTCMFQPKDSHECLNFPVFVSEMP